MRQVFGVRGVARVALGAALAVTATAAPATGAAAAEPRPRPRPALAPGGGARMSGAEQAQGGLARGKVRLAVTFAPGADTEAALAAARGHGAEVVQRIRPLHVVSVEVPLVAADRVAAALRNRPGVRDVAPVRTRATHAVPDDTEYATAQAYLADVNAPAAWEVTKGSADVLIAVIDAGVDVAHPDLAGKVAGAWDVVTGTADVTDATGHGTFVSGVAAAATDNATGVAGAGYDSRLLAVKAADDTGTIYTDAEAAGIVWAADNGAHVINISLGGATPDTVEQSAIQYAQGKGAIVVASAGNEATSAPAYPAAYAGVIAVGATQGGSRAAFSNYGSWVDVGAPGVAIRSTSPTVATGGYTAAYATADGTSFSAPLVAGQVALLRAAQPAATAAAIAAAVSDSTTGSYGFARGRVDFGASLQHLAPASVPSLTAPAAAATVGGDVTVSATSTAPKVSFSIDGGPTASVPVVDGVATTTLETYGLGGARTVTALDCTAHVCAANGGATRAVTVDNGTPTLTAPVSGAVVNTASFTAEATTPDGGGGVAFLVDGTKVAFDGAAPYTASIGTSALAEGAHQLTAVTCNRAGTTCDTARPSATVPFSVQALHPAVVSVAPNPFSPNKDGRADTATVTFTLDTAQAVTLQVTTAGGTVVRGPGSLGTLAGGTHKWVWDGKRKDGTVAPDGTYTVEVRTSKATANGTLSGAASRTVRVDKVAPALSSVSGSGTTFYPYKDGYRDTFAPAVTLGEAGRLVLNVYNSAGTRVRTVDGGVRAAGRHPLTWNGRRADGSGLPAGTYRYEFVATDAARNARVTSRYTVYLSAKKLEARTGTRTLTPKTYLTDSYVGDCSEGTIPASVGKWDGSVGYYSDFYECESPYDDLDDFVASWHAYTLPSAIRYGTIRIAATGREALAGYGDNAVLMYLDPAGDLLGYSTTLASSYGTHYGPSVASSKLRGTGRRVQWAAATVGMNWYEIRTFTVRWVYYVLV